MTEPAPTPRFDVRAALAGGWNLLRAHPLHTVLGALLATADIPGSGGINVDRQRLIDQLPDPSQQRLMALALVVGAGLGLCLLMVLFVVRCFGMPGWMRWLASSETRDAPDAGLLLSGSDAFLRQAGFRVLRGLVVYGPALTVGLAGGLAVAGMQRAGVDPRLATLLFVVGPLPVAVMLWLILSARLLLGDPLVALEGARPMAALTGSWRATQGATGAAVGWVIAMTALWLAALAVGATFCGVGLVVTLPLYVVTADLGRVRAWRSMAAPAA